MQELIISAGNSDNIFVCDTSKKKDKNKLYITCLEDYIFFNGLERDAIDKMQI